MRKIEIVDGVYRDKPVNGIFTLIHEAKAIRGGFAVGLAKEIIEGQTPRCFYPTVHSLSQIRDAVPPTERTDEEIIHDISTRFSQMEKMAAAVGRGILRSLIISGPAGLGKTYGVNKVLAKLAESHDIEYQLVKGNISAIGMYRLFYDMSDSNSVIVFDDIDAVFADETKLNLLKGALDSTEERIISWRTDNWSLKEDGVPEEFEFKGSVIFISNLDMERLIAKDDRLSPHLAALQSRSFYVDCGIHTQREKILRLVQVVKVGKMLKGTVKPFQEEEILNYIWERKDRLREISLRVVVKLSQLVNLGSDWKEMADLTCCKVGQVR